MAKLQYVSENSVQALRETIMDNLTRYQNGDFLDLTTDGQWTIELSLDVDLAPLADLDPSGTPEAEIANSRLVWRALQHLKPSVAYEEGIWVRLTHVECLEYSRKRWLDGVSDVDVLAAQIGTHFFARTLSMRRDDNAISRLWYNGYIAHQMTGDDDLPALDVFLRRADSRLTFLERSLTGSRPSLAAGVVRATGAHSWISATEENFRRFMIILNRLGGGKIFEAMSVGEIDALMLECARRAGMPS